MSTTPDEYPQFRTVLRGHDPAQVEQVLDELYAALDEAAADVAKHVSAAEREKAQRVQLQNRLEEAVARAEALERGDPQGGVAAGPPSFEALGSRLTSILTTAEVEAQAMRDEARAEAQQILDEARSTAEDLSHHTAEQRARADQEAARVVEGARAEAARMAEAARQRQAEMVAHHARIRAQLVDVRSALGGLLGSSPVQGGGAGATQGASAAHAGPTAGSGDGADASRPGRHRVEAAAAEDSTGSHGPTGRPEATQAAEAPETAENVVGSEVADATQVIPAVPGPDHRVAATEPTQRFEPVPHPPSVADAGGRTAPGGKPSGDTATTAARDDEDDEDDEDDDVDDSFEGEPWSRGGVASRPR